MLTNKKISKIIIPITAYLLFCCGLLLPQKVFCTIESPALIKQENLVDKFSLRNIEKITIKMHFSENYLSVIHKPFDYENNITDKKDIDSFLTGLSGISLVNAYGAKPDGEIIFYSAGREAFKTGLLFFYYAPVIVVDKDWYMFYSKPEQAGIIYKYMPKEFNEARERFIRDRKEGRVW